VTPDDEKKSAVFFSSGKIAATPSVAAPGDTHPSDATDPWKIRHLTEQVSLQIA